MTLAIGNRIGSYEVRASLGAGGMGEVYRARDGELDRDVALKVLPDLVAADADRLARFRREAQVLASLNHPNIAAIYGVVDFNGGRALVLELVEGPTLAERIEAGPIPRDEALEITRQIAVALEAAHERGIIHRDLKPANVKLRPDGTVKVLDFGLAKALEPTTMSPDVTTSPTITSPAMTQMGVILGTAAYMSPEQAKGRPADRRSDVWSFGCVLYEMLTGRRLFDAEDVADTLALVLTREPDWSLLPADTPPSIRRLLRRCLERHRSRRLADIADARLEIDERESDIAAPAVGATLPARRARMWSTWLPWVLAAAAIVTAVWLANRAAVDRTAAASRVVRSSIVLPFPLWNATGAWGAVNRPTATLFPGALSGNRSAIGAIFALSPDGRRLAIVMSEPTGVSRLWLRALDATEARPLGGTEGAFSPFWSPDGRWLAFVANGKLQKMDPAEGSPVTLCDSVVCGGAWSRDGVILFTHARNQALARISAAGGPVSMVTAPDTRSEWRHSFPAFLPDGRHFVFTAIAFGDQFTSHIGSLDSRETKKLPMESVFIVDARGCLLFAQGSTLMAQRFDERRFAPVGPAVPVGEKLRAANSQRVYFATTSANGSLVYQTDPSQGYDLVWYDLNGHATATVGNAADYADLTLSPDGRRALVSIAEGSSPNRDLWIVDLARGLRTRFTFDPASETHCNWSPDGSRIVFDSQRKGHRDLYLKAADGTGTEELLLADEFDKNPLGWSPDGRYILYGRRNGADVKIWVLPVAGDRRPFPFRETTATFQLSGAFSPDGHWVAYFSNESERTEVYVAPFPGPGPATQVSTAGGWDPRWSRDGKEIFYRAPDGYLWRASVSESPDRFDVGEVKPLFFLPRFSRRFTYDVSPDGQKILAVSQSKDAGTEPLTLVQNWPALLKK